MEWIKMIVQRIEGHIAPWVQRERDARRNAIASAHEADLVRAQRPMVSRILFELGVHERDNHIVDIVQAVVRGQK